MNQPYIPPPVDPLESAAQRARLIQFGKLVAQLQTKPTTALIALLELAVELQLPASEILAALRPE